MKFENYEVETMYYELHKKYGIRHSIPSDRSKTITYEYLNLLELDFKKLKDLFNDKNNWR